MSASYLVEKDCRVVLQKKGNFILTAEGDKFIYYKQDLNPSNVCEIVRMSVHKNYRGKGIGKRLCRQVERYAQDKGMKLMVVNTLNKMYLARRLYESSGFKLASETKLPPEELLEPDKWNEQGLCIVHYTKSL